MVLISSLFYYGWSGPVFIVSVDALQGRDGGGKEAGEALSEEAAVRPDLLCF